MSFYSTHDRRHAACPEKARYSKCLRCNRVHYHNSNQEGQTVRNKREVFPSIPDVNSATPIGEVNIADLKCGELITIKKVTTGDDFKRDRFSLVVDHHKGTFEFVSGEDLELLQLLRKLKNLNIEEHRWREERDRLRQVVTASANAQDEANDLVEKVRDERRQLVSRLGL